jgi:hypothetical protein
LAVAEAVQEFHLLVQMVLQTTAVTAEMAEVVEAQPQH